ncbi:hypothetical protein MKZ38_004797 [Zalerion maritima]|uniref:Uncharacterized protein n=1 Tax=Zalerion maritima TaxID=339359 RepID=A0AAD5RKW4_9PEZI|nr:hypothetical protein MKZ38_004797 [Zalerion maritima]
MLIIEVKARYLAAAYLREISRLCALFQERSATPILASYAAEFGAATLAQEGEKQEQYHSQGGSRVSGYCPSGPDWPSPPLDDDLNAVSEYQTHIKSNIPPLLTRRSSTTTGKRTTVTTQPLNTSPMDGQEESWEIDLSQNDYNQYPVAGGDNVAQGDSIQGSGNVVAAQWTDSEECMTTALLQAVGEDGPDFARSNASPHQPLSIPDPAAGGCRIDDGHPVDDGYPASDHLANDGFSANGNPTEHSVHHRNRTTSVIEPEDVQFPGLVLPRPEQGLVPYRKRTTHIYRLLYIISRAY